MAKQKELEFKLKEFPLVRYNMLQLNKGGFKLNKLSPEDIKEIYTSTESQKLLAKKYNISVSTVSKILSGKLYRRYTVLLNKPNRKVYMREPYLSDEKVKNIYLSKESVKYLAEEYNVNTATIYRIRHDINYKDVTKDLDNKDNKRYKRIDKLDIIDIYLDERSVKDIAKEYDINPMNVRNIKNKKTYRGITEELDLY